MRTYLSNQFPVRQSPPLKLYSLYEGEVIVIENQPYPVCNAERSRKIAAGVKKTNLHIKLSRIV